MNFDISQRLLEMRKKNNYTQQELAEKLYTSDSVISKWERGESSPQLGMLVGIAEIYDITLSELVGDKDTLSEVKSYWGKSCYRKRLPFTAPVAIVEIITSVFFIALLAYSIYLYIGLPDQIFTLFNSEGIGVGEGSKSVTWILLGLSIFFYVLFTIVQLVPFRLAINVVLPVYLDDYVQRTDHIADIRAKSSFFWVCIKLLLVLLLLPTALPLLMQVGVTWMFTATMITTVVFIVFVLAGVAYILWKCRDYYLIEQVAIKARRDSAQELTSINDVITPVSGVDCPNIVLDNVSKSCVPNITDHKEIIPDDAVENIVTDKSDKNSV